MADLWPSLLTYLSKHCADFGWEGEEWAMGEEEKRMQWHGGSKVCLCFWNSRGMRVY